jgi:MbtH protein
MAEQQDSRGYDIVVNHEEQYSLWPVGRELPAGWNKIGYTGTKEECLAHIEEIWTDMRPLSLRNWIRDHEHSVTS